VARDRFDAELEQRVLEVVRAYWELYFQRAVLLQQQAALRQAQEIHASILARQAFDSFSSQASRVRATVSIREADVARARAGVRNAEARLRQLTTSPLLGGPADAIELLPVEPPLDREVVLEPDDARELALANRSEIDEALTQVRAAGVRLGVAENEMLPSLGLVLETYLSGLEGNFDLSQSFAEQFSEGAPSYTAGVLFEIPLGRRAGFAIRDRRVLELRQSESLMRQTVADLSSEVEIALREVATTWELYLARRAAAVATTDEVRQKRARLSHIPGDDHTSVSYHLEDLLNAIDRLVSDETALAEAQRNYAVSIAEFNRATGTLVNVDTGGP
jgi:outer membrane protein TolC